MLKAATNPIFQRDPNQEQRELHQRTILRRQSGRRRFTNALHSRNAVKELRELPGMEESFHVVCRGNFPLFSLIPATLSLAAPAKIDALCIATLGFSSANVQALTELLDSGQVMAATVLASVFFERQSPKEWQSMHEALTARGQRIAALRSHAKIITMALSDGRRLACESSANVKSNRNLEQFTFTQSPALHDFHAGWIDEVVTAASRGSR